MLDEIIFNSLKAETFSEGNESPQPIIETEGTTQFGYFARCYSYIITQLNKI